MIHLTEDMLEALKVIMDKLERIEERLNKLEGKETLCKKSDKPLFHSLSTLKELEKARKKEAIEPALDAVADKVIEYFREHPPVRKVVK